MFDMSEKADSTIKKSNPIEWIRDVVSLCATNKTEREKSVRFQFLGEQYEKYTEEEKNYVMQIMRGLFETKDLLYIFSQIAYFIPDEIIQKELIHAMQAGVYSAQEGIVMEFQTAAFNLRNCHRELREFHKKNVSQLENWIGVKHPYTQVSQRNKKRIVLVTEQILDITHAPTRFILDVARILQVRLGFEVILIACPSDADLPEEMLYVCCRAKAPEIFDNRPFLLGWHDAKIRLYQYSMRGELREKYIEMLTLVYTFNPYFVFLLGVINPVADLFRGFVTTVIKVMSSGCPVSEADIYIRTGRQDPEKEQIYQECLSPHQTQIFLRDTFPFSFEKGERIFSREELNLPKDMFMIAIVGNHLDSQLDKDFLYVMMNILHNNVNIAFAIIGEIDLVRDNLSGGEFKNRVFYLGYCSDLMGVYGAINLYLNPKRQGGGVSAMMALAAGIPVVTLPECDVAFNVGSDFVVANYEEMSRKINLYANDNTFYEMQKRKAEERAGKQTESAQIRYVSNIIEKVTQIIEKDEGKGQHDTF